MPGGARDLAAPAGAHIPAILRAVFGRRCGATYRLHDVPIRGILAQNSWDMGVTNRVDRLRACGNGIVPAVVAKFLSG